MAGKRATELVKFTHTGEGDTVFQIVEMPESGALGYYSIFMRRVSGVGDGHIEEISGGFDAAGAHTYTVGEVYNGWDDDLALVRDGDPNRFPYLKIELEFEDDFEEVEEPEAPEDPEAPPVPTPDPVPLTTVVELYITAY